METKVAAPAQEHDPAARPRLYGIDGLRFLAALGVMLFHYVARSSHAWNGEVPVETFGDLAAPIIYFALAPELFFVVSGFVILMTAWGRDVPHVVASRVSRLYPSYWVAVIATSVLLLWLAPHGKNITFGQAAVNLTMFQALFEVEHVDGVYWTLWTELRFYLLIIVMVAIGITRQRLLWLCAVWPVAALIATHLGMKYVAMFLLGGYAPLFAGGMLLYIIYRHGSAPLPWLLLAGNVGLAVFNIVPAQMISLTRNTAYQPSPLLLGIGVLACFGLVAAVSLTRLRSLPWQWLAGLGALTYPLYLTHQHWGWWFIRSLSPHLPPAVLLPLTCAVALACAWLLYHGFEKHVGPRMRRWLQARLSGAGNVKRQLAVT